jgi:hypothetical protein
MKVWGVTQDQIAALCVPMDLRWSNGRTDRRAFAFKLDAVTSKSRYARRSSPSFDGRPGRRLTSLCYHGWRDFIRALFAAGATRVQTTKGDWRNVADFDESLHALASLNIGSMMYPFSYIEACEDKPAHNAADMSGELEEATT